MSVPKSRKDILHASCSQGVISWPITLRSVCPFDSYQDQQHLVESDNVVAALLDGRLSLKDKHSALAHYLNWERDRARRRGFRVREARMLAMLYMHACIGAKSRTTRKKLMDCLQVLTHDAGNTNDALGVLDLLPANKEPARAIAA